MDEFIRDPGVPYVGPIHGKFIPGILVIIRGKVTSNAERFNINLQCGPETVPRDDVAMQIAVHSLDSYVSLNSLENGIWGKEQECTKFPFKRAEKFEICLKCRYHHYVVTINGQHFSNFPRRIHYDRISHLAIDGDVSITRIGYISAMRNETRTTRGGAVRAEQATASVPALQLPNENRNFEARNSVLTTPPQTRTTRGGAVRAEQATASVPALQLPNENRNFEARNSVPATPPPSYDATMQNNPIAFAAETRSAAGSPYPTACPYPPIDSPHFPTPPVSNMQRNPIGFEIHISPTGGPYRPTSRPGVICPRTDNGGSVIIANLALVLTARASHFSNYLLTICSTFYLFLPLLWLIF